MEISNFSQLNLDNLYTYTDYLTWKFEERVELIKGKVFKMAAPSSKHQRVSINLYGMTWQYFRNKPCQVFPAPFDVRLPIPKGDQAYTVVQPDLCVICDKNKIDKRGAIGAPDLVVEILSPGNTKREMKDKFKVYEEAGVSEYWLVQPMDKTVLIYTLNDKNQYIGLKPYTEDDSLKSMVFRELEIPLQDIFNL